MLYQQHYNNAYHTSYYKHYHKCLSHVLLQALLQMQITCHISSITTNAYHMSYSKHYNKCISHVTFQALPQMHITCYISSITPNAYHMLHYKHYHNAQQHINHMQDGISHRLEAGFNRAQQGAHNQFIKAVAYRPQSHGQNNMQTAIPRPKHNMLKLIIKAITSISIKLRYFNQAHNHSIV